MRFHLSTDYWVVKVKLLPHHTEVPTLESWFCSGLRQKHRTRNCREHPWKQMCVTRLNCNYFPGTGCTSHFYRQILESTAQLYNENTDIRGENQSLPHHLSHIPDISGQNPQGETTLRSLSPLATSGYQNKRCGEQHYYTIHNSPSFLLSRKMFPLQVPRLQAPGMALGNPPFTYKIHPII